MKHDYQWFVDTLRQVCYDCFTLVPEDDEAVKPTGEDEDDPTLPKPEADVSSGPGT